MSRASDPLHRGWRLWNEPRAQSLVATLFHCAASVAAWIAFRRTEVWQWALIAIAFAIIAMERYLGLLPRLAGAFRRSLRHRHRLWPWRRPIQAVVSILIGGTIICAMLATPKLTAASASISIDLAWWATILVGGFVLVRSISLHEIDGLLYRRSLFPRLPLNLVIEITAALAIIIPAVFNAW